MFKQVLLLLSIPILTKAFIMNYAVCMEFKRGEKIEDCRNSFIVNGKKLRCKCGRPPSYLLFSYGFPEAFCFKCFPLRQDDFESIIKEALTTSEGNENGAHHG